MKTDIELLKNTLTLQELSECCVCMHALCPSHSLCETGHGVCGKCKSMLTECPMCKGKFVLDNAILLNQILELLPKPCRYYNKGCTFVGCPRDHEEFCIFRPSQCRVITCEFEGTVKDVVDHVKSAHSGKVLKMSPNCEKSGLLQFKNSSSHAICYTPIFYDGNFFWKYLHKDRAKKVLTHAFYHVPFEQPTKSYVLQVEFDKLEEKLRCPSQIEMAIDQKCSVLQILTEDKLDTAESSDALKQEIPEVIDNIPDISEPTGVEKLDTSETSIEPKVEILQKSAVKKLKCSDENDVSISTALLSRKRDKKGGYKYNYSVSIQEENQFEE